MNSKKDDALHLLFPIPVGLYDFPYQYNEVELNYLKNTEKHVKENTGNIISQNSYVLDNQAMSKLKQYIQKMVNHHFKKTVTTDPSCSLYVTQSWVNYTDNKQYHHLHRHYNSYFSGVLYLNTNEDDYIRFYSPTSGTLDPVLIEPAEVNNINGKIFNLPVKSNTMVLFPSYLPHSVEPVTGSSTRCSLAFNTFVRGVIGEKVGLYELILK